MNTKFKPTINQNNKHRIKLKLKVNTKSISKRKSKIQNKPKFKNHSISKKNQKPYQIKPKLKQIQQIFSLKKHNLKLSTSKLAQIPISSEYLITKFKFEPKLKLNPNKPNHKSHPGKDSQIKT